MGAALSDAPIGEIANVVQEEVVVIGGACSKAEREFDLARADLNTGNLQGALQHGSECAGQMCVAEQRLQKDAIAMLSVGPTSSSPTISGSPTTASPSPAMDAPTTVDPAAKMDSAEMTVEHTKPPRAGRSRLSTATLIQALQ